MRKLRSFGFWAGATLTVLLFVSALAAPLIAPHDPSAQDSSRRLEGPSREHPFGLDDLGRDVLSRIVWGARVSLRVGLSVVVVSSLLGVLLGALAGYFGGAAETIVMRVCDTLLAFPGILLAIALVAMLGPNLDNVIIALSIIGWVASVRRSQAKKSLPW